MIFVTVGTQLAFPRLIDAVDSWAARQRMGITVFGQIGPSVSQPQNFRSEKFISPAKFERCVEEASLVVAHAGIGTIVSALLKQKPIIVMPRLAKFGEQRNDHQLATVRQFAERRLIHAVLDAGELITALNEHVVRVDEAATISEFASEQLITTIRRFIDRAIVDGGRRSAATGDAGRPMSEHVG